MASIAYDVALILPQARIPADGFFGNDSLIKSIRDGANDRFGSPLTDLAVAPGLET